MSDEDRRNVTTEKSSLKRDTLAYGIAVLIDRLVGFALLPLLIAGLQQRDYGAWSQILAGYGLLSNVLLLGFFHTVSGMVAGRNKNEARGIYVTILGFVLVNCLLLSCLILISPVALSLVLFGTDMYVSLMLFVLGFFISECLYELIVLAFLRAEGNIKLCALIHAGKSLLRFPLVMIGLAWHEPLRAILTLLSLGNLVMVVVVLRQLLFLRERPKWQAAGYWRDALGKSAVVMMTLALAWGIASSNRFLIVHFLSLQDVAVYSANFSIMSIAMLVPMVISFTLLHHVSHHQALANTHGALAVVQESVALYLYAILPLLALTSLLYPQLLVFLANPGYAIGVPLLSSLLGYFFLFGLEQILVFATFAGEQKSALRARGVALGFTLIAGVVLIPRFGLSLAVLPAVLASAGIVVWCSHALWRGMMYRFPWPILRSVGPAVVAMILAGGLLHRVWPIQTFWETGIAATVLLAVYLMTESLTPKSVTRRLMKSIRGPSERAI